MMRASELRHCGCSRRQSACVMPLVTKTELLEIVPELRAMAAAAKTAAVRATLNRMADRYAAMVAELQNQAPIEDFTREIAGG
jgi:hypothetical protein